MMSIPIFACFLLFCAVAVDEDAGSAVAYLVVFMLIVGLSAGLTSEGKPNGGPGTMSDTPQVGYCNGLFAKHQVDSNETCELRCRFQVLNGSLPRNASFFNSSVGRAIAIWSDETSPGATENGLVWSSKCSCGDPEDCGRAGIPCNDDEGELGVHELYCWQIGTAVSDSARGSTASRCQSLFSIDPHLHLEA